MSFEGTIDQNCSRIKGVWYVVVYRHVRGNKSNNTKQLTQNFEFILAAEVPGKMTL